MRKEIRHPRNPIDHGLRIADAMAQSVHAAPGKDRDEAGMKVVVAIWEAQIDPDIAALNRQRIRDEVTLGEQKMREIRTELGIPQP